MNCVNCNKELCGKQRKFCSNKCKNQDMFSSGRLVNLQKRMAFYRKTELVKMFGGSCERCGYNKCLRSLSFHHKDRSTKKFGIAHHTLQSKNWQVILEEVKKCMLLCLNCHNELHSEDDNTYNFSEEDMKEYIVHKESKKIFKINCPFCGKDIETRRKNKRYCNNDCYKASKKK